MTHLEDEDASAGQRAPEIGRREDLVQLVPPAVVRLQAAVEQLAHEDLLRRAGGHKLAQVGALTTGRNEERAEGGGVRVSNGRGGSAKTRRWP